MKNVFDAKSIAVIGASKNPKKLGHDLLKNLIKAGYPGHIFPVNLKEKEILGIKTYSSVLDIHQKIDLAAIIVPREVVGLVLKQCLLKEIPYVLIISAGFAEKDATGKKLQKELLEMTARSKTKIIGPNCLGLIDTSANINLTFAATDVLKGNIGLVLQSGAIGAALFDWTKSQEIGISKFFSLGNKIHFTEIDALSVLENDPETDMIAIYLENISDPARFLDECKKITSKKPIIILQGGVTLFGAKAANSHTAALSTSKELNEALYAQANLISAQNLEELMNFLELFGKKSFNIIRNSVAIITNAGGLGILAADEASRNKINLPSLEKNFKNELKKILPTSASLDNPFDLGGDALALNYQKTLQVVEKSPQFGSILIILTPQSMTEIKKTAEVISKFKNSSKPIITSFVGGQKIDQAIHLLKKAHIPCYNDPAEGLQLIKKAYNYYRKRSQHSKVIEIKPVINQLPIPEIEIIKAYGLPFAKSYKVSTDAEVMGHLEEFGFPVVYKTAKNITHKGKAGKVGLNIIDQASLQRAVEIIGFPGILQEMIDSPYELLFGAKRDKVFGPLVIFGQGGIFTEEFSDIRIKLLPLTEADLDEMIEGVKIWPLIKEFAVKEKIASLILTLLKIIVENPSIAEIELNPVKVVKNNLVAVDINVQNKT